MVKLIINCEYWPGSAIEYNLFKLCREGDKMGSFGLPEIILILVVVLLLFGPGRIGKVAGELGSGIRNFRKGLQGDDEKTDETKKDDSSSTDTKS
jgi:sec-independent protein translocase protein TatA